MRGRGGGPASATTRLVLVASVGREPIGEHHSRTIENASIRAARPARSGERAGFGLGRSAAVASTRQPRLARTILMSSGALSRITAATTIMATAASSITPTYGPHQGPTSLNQARRIFCSRGGLVQAGRALHLDAAPILPCGLMVGRHLGRLFGGRAKIARWEHRESTHGRGAHSGQDRPSRKAGNAYGSRCRHGPRLRGSADGGCPGRGWLPGPRSGCRPGACLSGCQRSQSGHRRQWLDGRAPGGQRPPDRHYRHGRPCRMRCRAYLCPHAAGTRESTRPDVRARGWTELVSILASRHARRTSVHGDSRNHQGRAWQRAEPAGIRRGLGLLRSLLP